jgi:hypothetical protein
MATKYTKSPQKYTKLPKNKPNGHKVYQLLPLQDPPKFTLIGIFWFDSMPSGNPALKQELALYEVGFNYNYLILKILIER